MTKIAVLIPLILEFSNSVDFLSLIPKVEEFNLAFVELQTICPTHWNSNLILTNWPPNSQLVELVEEYSQLVELVKYFKTVFPKKLLSYPSINISSLNFLAELEMNVILFKI